MGRPLADPVCGCLQVLPGARISTDGAVVAGQSHVDEAMLTGEATPVLKQAGDTVIGGTLNLGGFLQVGCGPLQLDLVQ